MRPKLGVGQRLIQLGVLILLLVLWYIGTLPGHINPLLLPPQIFAASVNEPGPQRYAHLGEVGGNRVRQFETRRIRKQ